ncbi:MAG: hypothetical protein JST93_19790 [Acidobacteria bacterium]|nr:hypothetical protein [Acidobacteriota bacterium]
MNRKKLLTAALLTATAAAAQTTTSSSTREVHIVGQATSGSAPMFVFGEAGSAAGAMHFIAAGNMDGKIVKGSPYSAEATNETTRTLADGTRIVNKHTTQMARDKEGRTRRENNFANSGPFQNNSGAAPRMVTITDPVAKEVYILNYTDKTARKVKMGEPAIFRTEKDEGNRKEIIEEKIQVSVRSKAEAGAQASHDVMINAMPAMPLPMSSGVRVAFDSNNMKSEKLSPQTMEGLLVEGTRNTHTIPAGTIGNDRAIVSTNESWYSNDLNMVIFSKSNDPQIGETIYRVQNLRRSEPDASLFKIPADFKIVENSAPAVFKMRRDRPDRDEI